MGFFEPKKRGSNETDEHDEPVVHAADAAKGLNQRFFYPHSKEFKKNAGYVRKSTARRMKKAGL